MSDGYQGRLSGYMEWRAHVLPFSLSSLDHQTIVGPRQSLAPDVGRASYRPHQPTTAPLLAATRTCANNDAARPPYRPSTRPPHRRSCPCPWPDVAALVRAPSMPFSTAYPLCMLPLSKLYVCVD